MIEPSKIYPFIDKNANFTVAVFDARKVVADAVNYNGVNNDNFEFLRSLLLSAIPLTKLLKDNEGLGFYIDTNKFNIKLEVRSNGDCRCIMPEAKLNVNQKISGILRIVKNQPYMQNPYISHIGLDNIALEDIINLALVKSFQFESRVVVDEKSDLSFLVSKLPLSHTELNIYGNTDLDSWIKSAKWLQNIDLENKNALGHLTAIFSKQDFKLWQIKDIQLRCDCSKERLIYLLGSLERSEPNSILIDNKKEQLEVKCHYCGKVYTIESDLIAKKLKEFN